MLFENGDWMFDLASHFDRSRLELRSVDVSRSDFDLDALPTADVWFNRVSPSAHTRGHGSSVAFVANLLAALEQSGARVVNGSKSFGLETSKIAQHLLLRRLGVATPRTRAFNSPESLRAAAFELEYPRILKPNLGGSGAGVVRVESALDLLSRVELLPFGPDGVLLAQEVLPIDPIVRVEFIGEELVYAMKVRATNTFNLCPAELCLRKPVDEEVEPHVEFEPYRDIAPEVIDETRRVVRAAGLEVGGVEFVELPNGTRSYFDVNATSVHRRDISEAWGVNPTQMLAAYLDRAGSANPVV